MIRDVRYRCYIVSNKYLININTASELSFPKDYFYFIALKRVCFYYLCL